MNRIRRILPDLHPITLGKTRIKANRDTAAVSRNSTDCIWFRGKLRSSPAERLKIPTMLPTKRVNWLTSAEMRVVIPATGLALRLNRTAMIISGDSDARGATH
tara:strand:- start:4 stop:312 length:309 start_codon:yes stop_codon:yes gene_type:complete